MRDEVFLQPRAVVAAHRSPPQDAPRDRSDGFFREQLLAQVVPTTALQIICPLVPRWISTRGSRSRRSEEHTSELQSHLNLVCRLLLEKKNTMSARISATKNDAS